jgi:hypothetical protein
MIIDIKAELAKASKYTVYGNIGLASAPRGYIRANSSPEAADLALGRLKELSKDGPVTALHFKQAIQDFSEASQRHYASKNKELGNKASAAFNILVQSYIDATGDRDVYRALPEPQPIEIA